MADIKQMPPRTDWRVVGLLFLLGILAAWQFIKIALPLIEVANAYDRDPKSLAFLVSIVGLIGSIFGVIAGRVVAALGAKRAVLMAIVVGAAASMLQSLMPPLPAMTALRVIEGFSHLGIVVAAPSLMVAVASQKDRPIAMGIWAMFFGIAFALAAKIFPPIVQAVGLPGLFLVHGVALLGIAAALRPILPTVEPVRSSGNVLTLHRETYSNVRTAMPAAGFVFYTVTYLALLTFLPLELGRPELALTLPLISLAGTYAAGWIARSVAPFRIGIVGFVLTAICGVFLLFGQVWAAYPLFLAQGFVPGASFALIPYLNEGAEAQARATGAIAQMGNIGTTCGPPIFALALGVWSLGGMIWLLIGLSLVGASLLLILTRRLGGSS